MVVGGRLLRIEARSADGTCYFTFVARDPATGTEVWRSGSTPPSGMVFAERPRSKSRYLSPSDERARMIARESMIHVADRLKRQSPSLLHARSS